MFRNPIRRIRATGISVSVFFFWAIPLPAWAIDCTQETIELTSQAEVDNFQVTYGGGGICDTVNGQLTIKGEDIENLTGLADLVSIEDHLVIDSNPKLTNLDGFSSLVKIDRSLMVRHNPILADLDGLISLTHVGAALSLEENDLLMNLDGLSSVTGELSSLFIDGNDSLVDLDGLSGVTNVTGGLRIQFNAALTNLDGLNHIGDVGERLMIVANDRLTRVDGLSSVKSVGMHLAIQQNPLLTNLDGLSAVTSVGLGLWITDNGSLVNTDGLLGITRVGQSLIVKGNHALRDLDGLSNITSVLSSLEVHGNGLLKNCYGLAKLVDQVDDAEPGPGPGPGGVPDVFFDVILDDNSPGCNSIAEILNSAPLVEINAGLNDAWYNPDTDGQGFFIIVYPEIQQMFLTWFTYEVERPGDSITAQLGEPGHRWITAQGSYAGHQAVLEVWISKGGVFDSPVPETYLEPDGEIVVEFDNCYFGSLTYDIPSINRQGVVPIERIAIDNVALCAALDSEMEQLER